MYNTRFSKMKTTKYSTKENKKDEKENKITTSAFDFDFREPNDIIKSIENIIKNSIDEMNTKLNIIDQKIAFLEDISKCDLCKKIAERVNCDNCHKLVCCECCNTTYSTDGDYIYNCKKCS